MIPFCDEAIIAYYTDIHWGGDISFWNVWILEMSNEWSASLSFLCFYLWIPISKVIFSTKSISSVVQFWLNYIFVWHWNYENDPETDVYHEFDLTGFHSILFLIIFSDKFSYYLNNSGWEKSILNT